MSVCESGRMTADLTRIVELELSLLTPAFRRDRAAVADLLHPDFREVGASGRQWTRAEIIDELARSPDGEPPTVRDVTSRALCDGAVLITFTTVTHTGAVHRCSIWVNDGNGWSVLFHQGTPATTDR